MLSYIRSLKLIEEKEQEKLINILFIYQLLLKKIIDLIGSWGGYEIYYEQNENSKK